MCECFLARNTIGGIIIYRTQCWHIQVLICKDTKGINQYDKSEESEVGTFMSQSSLSILVI